MLQCKIDSAAASARFWRARVRGVRRSLTPRAHFLVSAFAPVFIVLVVYVVVQLYRARFRAQHSWAFQFLSTKLPTLATARLSLDVFSKPRDGRVAEASRRG